MDQTVSSCSSWTFEGSVVTVYACRLTDDIAHPEDGILWLTELFWTIGSLFEDV